MNRSAEVDRARAERLGQVRAVLAAINPSGPEPTAREVAELLWFAKKLKGRVTPKVTAHSTNNSPGMKQSQPHPVSPPSLHETQQPTKELYLPEPQGTSQPEGFKERASYVRVQGETSLMQKRQLIRALRPLKRYVDSSLATVVDEEATAARIADYGYWTPAFRPGRERWLSVNLILDGYGESAVLWWPLARELRAFLEQLGIFRKVALHHLRPREDGRPGLGTSTSTPIQALRSPATSVDSTGRTVTLVISDGVSTAWHTPTLQETIRLWGANGPTAILQTLPERLWNRTALAPTPVRFSTSCAGSSNTQLRYEEHRLQPTARAKDAMPIPVLEISPQWLTPWAQAISSTSCFDGVATFFPSEDRKTEHSNHTQDPYDKFEEFRANATPRVFRLASYLAKVPLNLSIMRIVQSEMLPQSPLSDLAEVVFSGLIQRTPGPHIEDETNPTFDFLPGIRERLVRTLRLDEAGEVIDRVSDYMPNRRAFSGEKFTAAVPSPEGMHWISRESLPWTKVPTHNNEDAETHSQSSNNNIQPGPPEQKHHFSGDQNNQSARLSNLGIYASSPDWQLRIVSRDEATVLGAAVLVSPDHVVTCAHVLRRAIKNAGPGSQVLVDAPRGGNGWTAIATVVEDGWWWEDESPWDVAVLRLDRPASIAPAVIASPHRAGEHVRLVGFPQDRGDRWITGHLIGDGGRPGFIQINTDSGFFFGPGFSGSGVRPANGNGLLGIVTEAVVGGHIGWMIPMSAIPRVWFWPQDQSPPLGEQRDPQAVTAITEAVGHYRTLADQRPDAFLPDLAASLNNQSVDLAGVGRVEEALEAITEAVQIRRILADQRPDAFLPDLAASLNNQSIRLGDLGRVEEALEAITEAVGHYRTLADQRPDAFLPDLAASLKNQATHLSTLGRPEEAIKEQNRSRALYQQIGDHHSIANDMTGTTSPHIGASYNIQSTAIIPNSTLDQKEIALLKEIATGVTTEVAARRLNLDARTLRRRVRNICDKLDVNTPIEAVVWAARQQII